MWDQRYSEPGFAYGTAPNDFLAVNADLLPRGGDVLCLAEGEGRNAVFLARRDLHVTGVDSSAVGLAKANALAAQHGVQIETVVADLADYDLGSARWDGVVSIWCHLPSALRRAVHARVVSALRPGGVFLLEAYTPAQLQHKTGGPMNPDMLMTADGLSAELAGLDIVQLDERVREVHEGAYHDGTSAVVQLVARKRA